MIMDTEMLNAIKQWETEYPTMEGVKLTDQQKRILSKGPEHNEGMVYGTMYNDWKKRRGYD
tara:strand:+ start:448 stop:630 length:183 start_codon:yes stop_codon:yes gene_type:complete